MKSTKRNRRNTIRAKQQRHRTEREIEALAKQGKTAQALKLAMGGNKFTDDSARRIVESWRAVIELERHPELLPKEDPDFYQHLLKWAKNETWMAIHRVMREGNENGQAEAFFLRMAREARKPSEPNKDDLRTAILANRLRHDIDGNPAKSVKDAKGIAFELGYDLTSDSGARVVRRADKRMRQTDADK